MSKMIRCIEGHVFDSDKQDKCPACGWSPKEAVKKTPRDAEPRPSPAGAWASVFGTLTSGVERGLAAAGLGNKPGLAAGIVYAAAILFFVTAVSALPGTPFWPGRGDKDAVSKVSVPPAEAIEREVERPAPKPLPPKEVAPLPLPPQQSPAPPERKSVHTGPSGGEEIPGPAQPPQSAVVPVPLPIPFVPPRASQVQPRIVVPRVDVPNEVKRFLRNFR